MKGKIYKITNRLNNKVYIGQTIQSLKERFSRHCSNYKDSHFNMPIKQAILKYGKDNFIIELIEEVEQNKLNEREVYWISVYDSYNRGYNCTKGGQNGATVQPKLSWKEENEIIESKYLGFSCREIAKVYSIDRSTVHNIFKRHNLKMPNKRNLESRINKDAFLQFLTTKPTLQEIESKFNICKCSVYNYLKKHHIEYNFSKSVQALASNVEG